MRLSTSRLDERDFDSLPPALRRKVSDSRTKSFLLALCNRSMSCMCPVRSMQDGKRRHEPLTGSCKIFAAKSGYLGAKNHIASAYRCAIHKGLSELTGLSLKWEWSGSLGSVPEGPAQARRHALVPHPRTPNYHICRSACFISRFGPRRTRSLASFSDGQFLRADY
jgi:hypothetical protein